MLSKKYASICVHEIPLISSVFIIPLYHLERLDLLRRSPICRRKILSFFACKLWECSSVTNCLNLLYKQGASILGAAVSGTTRGPSYNKDRCFTLLVIDDQNTDWSKYFRGRRLHGDYEIRVEQAEFRELSLTASETGTIVSMAVYRNGTKVIR